MDRAFVAFERRPPDERPPAEKDPARQRWPASQAVERAGLREEIVGRGHHVRPFQRVRGFLLPADRGQRDEARLFERLVPTSHRGVRGPQVESPAGHLPALYRGPVSSLKIILPALALIPCAT